jgi:hypothetical protein
MTKDMSFFEEVLGESGFKVLQLCPSDLALFRAVVENHYKTVLFEKSGIRGLEFLSTPMPRYHEISKDLDHAKIWTKQSRILPESAISDLAKSELFQLLEKVTGGLEISSEEGSGYPEIYWRLVRPRPFLDTGPMHADAWFWELDPNFDSSEHITRIKFWVGLWTEPSISGFKYVSGSHKTSFPYSSELRDGKKKPKFDHTDFDLEETHLESKAGTIIIFNDRLLHGGVPGNKYTRVSLEFTFFVSNSK